MISQDEYFRVVQEFADKLPKDDILKPKFLTKTDIYKSDLDTSPIPSKMTILDTINQDLQQILAGDNQAHELLHLMTDFRTNQRWKGSEGDWNAFYQGLEDNLQMITKQIENNRDEQLQYELQVQKAE